MLGGKLDALPRDVRDTTRIPLGIYRGLRFGLVLHPQFPPNVYLEGATTRQSGLSRDHQGPRAVLNAFERLAGGYGSECDRIRQDLAIAESQLRDYQARLGKPFLHDGYLSELTGLRDQLKAGLSASAQVKATKPDPRSPNSPNGSKRSRLRTASKRRHSASGKSNPPPRSRLPHGSAAGRKRSMPPKKRSASDVAASEAGDAAPGTRSRFIH